LENGLPQKNKYCPFVPNPQQMKLAPSVSGNTIKGLDEEKVTKPKVVYWATEPNEIPHGEMQKWFYTVDPCLPDFAQERQKRLEIQNMPLPPISAKASVYSSDIWWEKLDKFVTEGVCEDACPPFAILSEKKKGRGIKKWYVDFDKCLPFFNQHQGCGICIAVCPWSLPGVGLNLAEKLEQKKSSELV
tara:strand:- start:170 stop:733 length:564 start_codon:yes stop_codon:yes gene_type:complete